MLIAKTAVMIVGQILYFRVWKGLDVTLMNSVEWAIYAFIISFLMTYAGRRLFNYLHTGRVDAA